MSMSMFMLCWCCVARCCFVVVVVVEVREEKENWRDKSNHLAGDSRQSFRQDCLANDWGNRERVALDLFSNWKMGKIQKLLW